MRRSESTETGLLEKMEANNFMQRASQWPAQTKSYVEDLQGEMRRVTWPSWKQVRATTGVVIGSVFAFAAYFAIVDLVVGRGVNKLFDAFSK
jgi:preprotein translocase subunit SecE